jgi:hypothetical protein
MDPGDSCRDLRGDGRGCFSTTIFIRVGYVWTVSRWAGAFVRVRVR